jgi:ribosomal protein S18 acetylase RimI-like enzyme
LTRPGFQITPARSAAHIEAFATLLRAYADSIGVDLGYQDVEAELDALPGKYAPPQGEVIIALAADGEPVGCVALRPMPDAGICEMKRLYVAPSMRGSGLGRALIDRIIGEARGRGYREMWLDTLPSMAAAQSAYRSIGFRPIEPYYDTPVEGTVFLGLDLNG